MPLRNEDYTDRELLHVVNDVTTADGWADTAEITERLGMSDNGGKRHVASRMAWMVRYKFCQRHPDKPGAYRLTKEGRALMGGRLSEDVQDTLGLLSDGDRVLVMRSIASVGFDGSLPTQHMLRREYLHHYSHRRRPRARK